MGFETNSDFLNAKIHGMRSNLLGHEKLLRYLEQSDERSLFVDLQVEVAGEDSETSLPIERVLIRRDLSVLNKINKFLSEEDRIVVNYFLLQKYQDDLPQTIHFGKFLPMYLRPFSHF